MQALTRFISITIAAALFLSGCANLGKLSEGGAEMAQVPITENPSGKIYPGKFVWHDLLTPDAAAAGKFYEKLFGWQVEYHDNYAVLRNDGKLVAGILEVKPSKEKEARAIWIPSVSVVDVDGAATLMKKQGGKILNGPVDMGKRGRAALIKDDKGALLVLLRATGGDPADADAAIGDWLWNEIWTRDPEATEAFYTATLGYDEVASGDDYDVLISQGKWRAGVRHLQDEQEPVRWVPVVRVADPEATAKRVNDLGGMVWITPDQAPSKGNTALIGDPAGAMLLIQRWPISTSRGGN